MYCFFEAAEKVHLLRCLVARRCDVHEKYDSLLAPRFTGASHLDLFEQLEVAVF